jgi:hypothetical protein
MQAFAERMLAAKRLKREQANNGEAAGNYGIRQLTTTEIRDRDGDKMAVAFAKLRQCFDDYASDVAADLHWIMFETSNPDIADVPF